LNVVDVSPENRPRRSPPREAVGRDLALGPVVVALSLLITLSADLPATAQLAPLPHEKGVSGLGLVLRRLPVVGRVLLVTAHPDDEDNGLLVRLRQGLGLRTALLSLTRGDGGQNEIGPELFEALGVLRTEELMAVHRYDDAEQYFSRAYEFGYSFSVEETFDKWGRDEILADVVEVVRRFRPDVMLTLPLEAPGGGQHHQAAARLAAEAFRAAAAPERFPEQMKRGLRPWQAKRLFEARWVGAAGVETIAEGDLVVDTSRYDPLLGSSWFQLGALARASHRCQGMSPFRALPGRARSYYALVDSEPALSAPPADLLEGIDVSLERLRLPALTEEIDALEDGVRRARQAFQPEAPAATLEPLREGLAAVRRATAALDRSDLEEAVREDLRLDLEDERRDLEQALTLAHGLSVAALADDGDVVPGQELGVTVLVHNPGPEPIAIGRLAVRAPEAWTVEEADPVELHVLGAGEDLTHKVTVRVGGEARYSQPYWHKDKNADRFINDVPADATLPWSPPDLVVTLTYLTGGVPVDLERPVEWRYPASGGGEKQKVVNVVPAVSVRLTPGLLVVPVAASGSRREMRVELEHAAPEPSSVGVRLLLPTGWTVEPEQQRIELRGVGEQATLRFFVTPPRDLAEGEQELQAIATCAGKEYRQGVQVIAYDHIQERHMLRPATTRVRAIDVRTAPGARVGYVMGVGDRIPEAIRALGIPVTLLGPDDLGFGDLSPYSTIVTGIRAYKDRTDLRAHQKRLMRYVEEGGHLVVMYNKFELNTPALPGPDGEKLSPFAPLPARVSSNRVTVEEAPVRRLRPEHPLLRQPNRITARDFEGWVQERGLYFLDALDPRYVELLSSEDPWPNNAGEKLGLLVTAPVGAGTWTYVGVGLFRQLPEGVPGAYRLLANLLAGPESYAADESGPHPQ
jgi:LmbE family N-acetylglucosaminyl deacetylase